jgi:hypothetical protein
MRRALVRAVWELLQTAALTYAAVLVWREIDKGRNR